MISDKDWCKLAALPDPESPFNQLIESPEDGGYLLGTDGHRLHVASDLDVPEVERGIQIGKFLELMAKARLIDCFAINPRYLMDALKGFASEENVIVEILFSPVMAGHVLQLRASETGRRAYIFIDFRPEE